MKFLIGIMFYFCLVTSGLSALTTAQWREDGTESTIVSSENASDIGTLTYDNIVAPANRLLSGFIQGVEVQYASAASLTVAAGQISIPNSAGATTGLRMFSNPSATTVTWANIDTGAEEVSTKYTLFAVGDADTATFTISASKSSSSPTGATYFVKIGSFYNDSSGNIDSTKVNSIYLKYSTDKEEWDYNKGWFTANTATTYTKAHGLTLTIPTDALEIEVYWRSSSSDTAVYPLDFSNEYSNCALKYNATNIYVRSGANWGYNRIDSASLESGEVLILAKKIIVNF